MSLIKIDGDDDGDDSATAVAFAAAVVAAVVDDGDDGGGDGGAGDDDEDDGLLSMFDYVHYYHLVHVDVLLMKQQLKSLYYLKMNLHHHQTIVHTSHQVF